MDKLQINLQKEKNLIELPIFLAGVSSFKSIVTNFLNGLKCQVFKTIFLAYKRVYIPI